MSELCVRRHDVEGDLLEQPVEALVNAWNPNFLPWWWPSSGVSGALKKHTGSAPWRELHRKGYLRHGTAVTTGVGALAGPQYLIHVVGLNNWWRATRTGVNECARNAILEADELGVSSVAMPLIGSGTGGLSRADARAAINEGLSGFLRTESADVPALDVYIVEATS